ncbi:hypothetical protein ACL02T_34035 [Pseudonocardia sp. RS010]|uniref:hypothetical protein n=1 Tax=Pseudonocardia sp. RS010 TaxID=3385979 RepID=UPI0039A34501
MRARYEELNLDSAARCPLGHRCESCGTADGPLAVRTATTPLGVLCLTLCPPCAATGGPPPITVGTAARLVGQHAEHLGVDLDEMADAMEPR